MTTEDPKGIYFNMGSLAPEDMKRVKAEVLRRGYRNLSNPTPRVAQSVGQEFVGYVQGVSRALKIDPTPLVEGVEVPIEMLDTDPERFKREVWDKQSSFWIAAESPANYEVTMETLMTYMRIDNRNRLETIASLGSGPGLYETFLAAYFKQNFPSLKQRFVCFDFAPQMTMLHCKVIAMSRLSDGRRLDNVKAVTGDISALQVPDDSFDQIICNNSLQWVTDWKRAVREMARTMNPEGLRRLYILINNNPMVVKKMIGEEKKEEDILLGAIDSSEMLDELEADGFQIQNTRQFTTRLGLGQGGGQTSRLFILARYQPEGIDVSWREASVSAQLSTR